jgi:hypothetical protein
MADGDHGGGGRSATAIRERQTMAHCITCGVELPAERAEKYDYCTAADCQAKNVKGLTMVAIAQNKAADEYLILDEDTRHEMASGRYRDQRRATFGPRVSLDGGEVDSGGSHAPAAPDRAGFKGRPVRAARRPAPAPTPKPVRRRWSRSQEKLALLYNEQGIKPDEIARRLRLSTYTVTQIILSAKNRRRR